MHTQAALMGIIKVSKRQNKHITTTTIDRYDIEQRMPKDRKQTGKDSRRERQQMNIKLPCWGIYLRLLLGWMRSWCTAASAAAMAAPASSRWVWATLVLLWLRDGPWDRRWPSDDDFELPGLLWDFSMVGTCISGYKGIKKKWVKVASQCISVEV